MRTAASRALPGTAVVQTSTWVSDGGGGGTTAWAASGTVDCRLAPFGASRGEERLSGGRISPDADSVVTLPSGTAVDADDQLVISGGTYSVVHVRERSWETSRRVEVTRQW